jgi:putative transposase
MLCRVLQVARSAFYAWMAAPDRKRRSEAALRVQIHSIYKASRSTYGSPRIAAALRNDGVVVNHKKVERIMRAEGLQGVPRKRFRRTTNSNHANVIARNILDRDFKVSAPNRVWVGDITYLRVGSGWAFDAGRSTLQYYERDFTFDGQYVPKVFYAIEGMAKLPPPLQRD